ncbi:RHS repeat-associated core domain-containing protein [Thermoflexibacter ruber]|uniref:RHS repeat-associated core domain-containing protein n=1 Tax=Thermoflexibacter ruber TaxID=1003 RepID=A0A1I2KKN6_9BACT|nr:RHS repeat-associated core domain-containing protein [Thermoflexibacter ruber]SFF65516.1 RHS repeat-associated core domain-containing protein [Thermoflexibacter ruber]
MKSLDYVQTPAKEDKWLFNGKEKQTELELHHYDFSARSYDYQTGRTTTLDPHGDRYVSVSPYSFLNNNLLRYIDPTGMDGESILPQGTAYDQQKERDRKQMENLSRNYRTISYLWKSTPQNVTLQASNNGDGTLNFYAIEWLASPEAGNTNLMNDWHSKMGLWHVGTLKLSSYYNPIANAVRGGRDGYSSDSFHEGVSLFGFVPIVGDLADLLDAAVYAMEGNYRQAAISSVAAVPVIGSVIAIPLKTSSKLLNPSRTYTLYNKAGDLY